jgi:hypothetical protein
MTPPKTPLRARDQVLGSDVPRFISARLLLAHQEEHGITQEAPAVAAARLEVPIAPIHTAPEPTEGPSTASVEMAVFNISDDPDLPSLIQSEVPSIASVEMAVFNISDDPDVPSMIQR